MSLLVVGVLAVVSGLALLEWGEAPDTALGWVLLPLGGAALVLVEALAQGALAPASRASTFRGLVLWVIVLALCATALAVAWTLFA